MAYNKSRSYRQILRLDLCMTFVKNRLSIAVILIILFSCSSNGEVNKNNVADQSDTVQTDSLSLTGEPEQKDSVHTFYIDDLDFDLVIQGMYGKDTMLEVNKYTDYKGIVRYDTLMKGKVPTPGYEEGREWFEEFTIMNPLLDVVYTEDGFEKAAFLFSGDYVYQHGHTWSIVDVFFFVKEKDKWRFTDSLSFEDFDVDNVEEVNLSKDGFVIRSIGVWANMGADSERQSFWFFRNEEMVMDIPFWTGSGSMFGGETGEEYTSRSAEIVFGNDSTKKYRDIYYYGERYDCTKEEAEDDLSFCSCKFVYEKDGYEIYPLSEKERPKK